MLKFFKENWKSILILIVWIFDFIMGITLAFKSSGNDLVGLIFGLVMTCISAPIIPMYLEELINKFDNTLVE